MAIGLSGFTFPLYAPIAKTIGLDLVSVKPLGPPTGILHYIDYKYDDTLYQRRLKLEKIFEKIKEKQNGDINEQTTDILEYKQCN